MILQNTTIKTLQDLAGCNFSFVVAQSGDNVLEMKTDIVNSRVVYRVRTKFRDNVVDTPSLEYAVMVYNNRRGGRDDENSLGIPAPLS